jgi:hypothetical protein
MEKKGLRIMMRLQVKEIAEEISPHIREVEQLMHATIQDTLF